MCGCSSCVHICLSSSVDIQVCRPLCVLLCVRTPSGGGDMTHKAGPWACLVLPLLIGWGHLQLLDLGSPSRLLLRCEKKSGHDKFGLNHTPDRSLAPLVLRCPLTLDNANMQRREEVWKGSREAVFIKAKDHERMPEGTIVLSLLHHLKHQWFRVLKFPWRHSVVQ